ncbi:myb/SANT-like DNA-binding domain-containing protein 4 isoform X2 [Ischnura elegans]|uniref:myb/SANT-like DNA-binding domain-containing protein 4 isoform X2 n=1 Tax=Ischnura elegans TaxID=197161 RepID=UPI001ED86E3C|nr:myb/SANT-like DNA-binding domain-containing protein 4 isoform X2 [Ischnura elegans]
MAGSGGKASHAQMEKMLQFLKKHPSLVHGKPGGNVDRSMNHHLWQTLSEILNADGSGPAKPPLKWQKSWIDWKSNTKKKYMRIKNYMKESNDGSPCPFTLSKIEEKLVAFLYPESYEEDSLLSEQCHQSSDNDLEPQYEYKDSMPETYAIEEVDVELDINEEEKVSLQPKKKQKIHNEDLGEYQYQEVEKNEGYETKRLELEERKLLLKERAIRDKERRTDIFDKAVRDKERRSELYDRAVRDKERRSDICDRSVREKARKTEILTRIVRDMERRTEILNRTSVAIIKALAAFTDSMSRQK